MMSQLTGVISALAWVANENKTKAAVHVRGVNKGPLLHFFSLSPGENRVEGGDGTTQQLGAKQNGTLYFAQDRFQLCTLPLSTCCASPAQTALSSAPTSAQMPSCLINPIQI